MRSREPPSSQVFVDHSVIECYAAGGRAVVTERTYPLDAADGVALFNEGSAAATLRSLEAHELRTIWAGDAA